MQLQDETTAAGQGPNSESPEQNYASNIGRNLPSVIVKFNEGPRHDENLSSSDGTDSIISKPKIQIKNKFFK